MRNGLGLAFVLAWTAACATSPGVETAPDAVSEAAYDERNDPFTVMIYAERYSILVSRALEGARGAPVPYDENRSEVQRAREAVLETAHDLYVLRDRVCAAGLVAAEECGPLPPPDWFGVGADDDADLAEVNRRIEWLEEVIGPFMNAGCRAGEALQDEDEPYFCAVE
jgi:hypothetical protein